jgi:hypothetical protein
LLTLGKYYDSFKLPIQWHEAWLRGNLNPLLDGQIAQPVEHSPEKAGVVGSIPTLTTLKSPGISLIQRTWAFYFNPENDNIDTIFQIIFGGGLFRKIASKKHGCDEISVLMD